MPVPVTVDDVDTRSPSPLTEDQRRMASALLTDAWAVLTQRIPDIDTRIASGSPSDALVVAVVSGMVLRVLRNPDGKYIESIDDYSFTRDRAVAEGRLYISDDEVALLLGTAGFSITSVPVDVW